MIVVKEGITFHLAHRLENHNGLCKYLHGHSYRLDVAIESEALDEMNMVIDFNRIKSTIKTWVDSNLDHAFALDAGDSFSLDLIELMDTHGIGGRVFMMRGKPTAESMSHALKDVFDELADTLWPVGVKVVGIKVWETDTAYAMVGRFNE